MRKIILVIIMAVCCFYGCNNSNDNSQLCLLDNSVKVSAKELVGETSGLNSDKYIYASRYMLYKDTILIVCNTDNKKVKFLEIYDIKTGSLIKSYFTKGNGPNEMLSPRYNLNGAILSVDDFQKKRVVFLNLDSVILSDTYTPIFEKYNHHALSVSQYKDGKQLILNPYCYNDGDIYNNAPRFIVAQSDEASSDKEYKYNTFNLVDGFIITNYNKDRVMYASLTSPVAIELYNSDLKLLKTIIGPDKYEVKYRIEDGWVSFLGGTPTSYYAYCSTDNNVFLLYYGEMAKIGVKRKNWKPYIFVLDWDGNFQKSYRLDRYLYTISTSNDGTVLYGTGYNDKGLIQLYKYNL